MSKKNWKQGGAFGNLRKRMEHIGELLNKAAEVQAGIIEERIEHIKKMQKQVEVANIVKSMNQEDLKGKVISDELGEEESVITTS